MAITGLEPAYLADHLLQFYTEITSVAQEADKQFESKIDQGNLTYLTGEVTARALLGLYDSREKYHFEYSQEEQKKRTAFEELKGKVARFRKGTPLHMAISPVVERIDALVRQYVRYERDRKPLENAKELLRCSAEAEYRELVDGSPSTLSDVSSVESTSEMLPSPVPLKREGE